MKTNKKMEHILKRKQLYMMLIPFLLYYIFFLYRPLIGLQIAFKDYSLFKGMAESEWIGFDHFIEFFSGPYFFRLLKNTFLINLYGLVIGFPIPIILALMLNELKNLKLKKFVQTATYLPHFISAVVVAGIVTNLLAPGSGLFNVIIEKLGGEKIYFLTKPEYFRGIFTGMNIWKSSGYGAIVYLAALSGVDVNLYEAARIDGASKWKQLINVTIPAIMPTIIIMLILRLGAMLSVGFESIILLYQPSTYKTADVISSYVYRVGLTDSRYDFATAIGIFNSIVSLILIWLSNMFSRRFSETSLW
ncbi:MAG: ABC transporter permease subunit [Vallitalea sp.]|jgi:putative aldouronate transport system permease protein|nr:ABC transporter permease subunit [Vallitalea sp.]